MKDEILFWPFTHFTDNPLLGSVLIMLMIIYVIVLILQIIKNKHTLSISMILGLVLGLVYLGISSNLSPNPNADGVDLTQNYVDGIYIWLTMAWNIFMLLLLAVLPIYIFAMISTAFTNARHLGANRKFSIVSFLSLWGMSLLGIVIAICFFPIMLLLKDYMQTDIGDKSSIGIFGGIWPGIEELIDKLFKNYGLIAVITVVVAIIFAIIMNTLHKYNHKHGERLIKFIEKIKTGVLFYLKYVAYLVPYVISGMIVVLFANYKNTFLSTVGGLGIFIVIFFIGLITVWSIEFGIVSFLRKGNKESDKKEFRKRTREYVKNDFAVQSAPILFPITVSYVKKLGVDEDVAEKTTTFTTFMGYSMCGGFYPALVVMFTLVQNSPFQEGSLMASIHTADLAKDVIVISLMVPLILFMTLGMTGVPGIDVAIIIGLLSSLGLNPTYFYTIYLIDPMLDKFRGIGNSMGFSAAAVITNKICSDKKEKQNEA